MRLDRREGLLGCYVGMIIPLFSHKFANHRKNINSIWKIKDDDGQIVEGFDAIVGAGVQHFENLFKKDEDLHLPELMRMTENFPTTISDEDNYDLMSPVTLKEIQSVLAMSKNDKSPGPDGIPVEF